MEMLTVGNVVAIEYVGSDESIKTLVGTVDKVGADRVLVKLDGVFDTPKSNEKRQAYRTLMMNKILNVSVG